MFEKVFVPFGITSRPVLSAKSGSILETVVQLEIVARADVDVGKAPYRVCSCGDRKYHRDNTNYVPRPLSRPGHLFKSNQDFRASYPYVYISQELFRAIEKSGLRGAEFLPCKPGPGAS